MAQVRKLEVEHEIASSGDQFMELFSSAPHEISNIHPDLIQGCDLHEGEFGKPGFVMEWNYTLEGKSCVAKQRVESIDKKKKTMKLVVVEGDILEAYKSFEVTMQVLPKGEGMSVVKWSVEYEKVNEGVPDPHKLLEAALKVTQKIDNHHSNA